jgi:hypothetical protein
MRKDVCRKAFSAIVEPANRMNSSEPRRTSEVIDETAQSWARQLADRVEKVVQCFPEVDRENVRHTLILLEMPPLERLQRSLLRGGA